MTPFYLHGWAAADEDDAGSVILVCRTCMVAGLEETGAAVRTNVDAFDDLREWLRRAGIRCQYCGLPVDE